MAMEGTRNCYAVIFTSLLSGEDEAGYAAGCFHIDGVSVKKEL